MSLYYKNILPLFFLFAFVSCGDTGSVRQDPSLINTSHLDFLYQDIVIDGKEMGIIHIYSNYPDYKWTGDDDEGIACVDDASRAAVFYLKHYQYTLRGESLRKAKNLIEFILFMQADNGYFYNFIWEDHSINKEFRTSVAEPDWWSWRALWALTESHYFYKKYDPEFSERIFRSIDKIVAAVKNLIPAEYKNGNINGFIRPLWLPYKTASDQAAVLLLGLNSYCREIKDETILNYCSRLAEGIITMQEGDSVSFPYYAFLSWENLWHGWGNLQAYSLLKFYERNRNDSVKNAALKEVNFFYEYLIEHNFMNEFTVKKEGNNIISAEEKKFPQIAYMIRPMVFACLQAFEITKDSTYAARAVKLASWFFGGNTSGEQMYSSTTGRCYDGINSENELNKNSGAESTIEALLALIEIESNPAVKNLFYRFIKQKESIN